MSDGTLHALQGSPIRPFAETISWLWRVPLADTPSPDSVGLGTIDEGIELSSLLDAGELAGVALHGARPGPDPSPLPGRQRLAGAARFGPGLSTQGDFTVLHGAGRPVTSSNLGSRLPYRDGGTSSPWEWTRSPHGALCSTSGRFPLSPASWLNSSGDRWRCCRR